MDQHRPQSPSVARNRAPILAVLQGVLPPSGTVLEIASGTGEHATFFAGAFPHLTWQPSDPDPHAREAIDAWRVDSADTINPALELDVHQTPWPLQAADAVVCINMIHIAPWSATPALMAGAASALPTNGPLYLYGPFKQGGNHTSESNMEFEKWLWARNRDFGVRDLEAVVKEGEACGFALDQVIPMPANNLSVILRRQ
ncbi:MAG: DUF938 domain-containing protein [Magnetospiraceae bacterium]